MISKEILLANWDTVLKFSKESCFDYTCQRCPFNNTDWSISCGLSINAESGNLLEQDVKEFCERIVNERLHEIMEQK